MEVSWLEAESELQLLATATQNLSRVCDLHCSSRQHRILNPLSKARDRTRNLMDTSQLRLCNPLSHNRNSGVGVLGDGVCKILRQIGHKKMVKDETKEYY